MPVVDCIDDAQGGTASAASQGEDLKSEQTDAVSLPLEASHDAPGASRFGSNTDATNEDTAAQQQHYACSGQAGNDGGSQNTAITLTPLKLSCSGLVLLLLRGKSFSGLSRRLMHTCSFLSSDGSLQSSVQDASENVSCYV